MKQFYVFVVTLHSLKVRLTLTSTANISNLAHLLLTCVLCITYYTIPKIDTTTEQGESALGNHMVPHLPTGFLFPVFSAGL